MTIAPGTPSATELVDISIDDVALSVPKGTLVIRAAEMVGNEIPRFCDHPLLSPVAACRMCLVEIEGNPKPQPACAIEVTPGMKVRTARSSEMADKAQQGIMEFLLINHPLDCPICDKGGECPLQNQAMSAGRPETRFELEKRTFPKPIPINSEILLDRERCVSCARCTRFADEVAGDPKLELLERGAKQQVGVAGDEPFDSYYSGNTIQICPVGALTSAAYRFRARPFDLVSTPTACEHCASGCGLRTDVRRDVVMRRLAWDDPDVNEEWNCDKGRFAFAYLTRDRLTHPLVRRDGVLTPASWPEALDAAARGLASAAGSAAVLTGGRLSREDAYAYAKFARLALGTDDIDFRARASSDEEAQFLRAVVAGRPLGPTYADLDAAPTVMLVGLEPEDESPILLLRLRAAARNHGTAVVSVGSTASRALEKMRGRHVPVVPGGEAALLDALVSGSGDASLASALAAPGAVLLVGERLATVPGALSAAARLAQATGARLAWVPRRAGERGALDAGALAGVLPGGRPLDDASARAQTAAAWGVDPAALPSAAGRGGEQIAKAAAAGEIAALVVAGVDPADVPYEGALLTALDRAFVVSLETRHSAVTERADVVLPVAVVTEKAGTFVDWEGRDRPFAQTTASTHQTDGRVLGMLADAMDVPFGSGDTRALRAEWSSLGTWTGPRPAAPDAAPAAVPAAPPAGRMLLDSWRLLLDEGTLQQGEEHLAGTRRASVAKCSAATAAGLGLREGQSVTVFTSAGAVTLPLQFEQMVDGVVWLPWNSPGSHIFDLAALPGAVVEVRGGAA